MLVPAAAATAGVAKAVLTRRELRRSLEKVTAAANEAASTHGWILATAMVRSMDKLAETAREIADNITDAVINAIRDNTADALAALQKQSEECRRVVVQIMDSYKAVFEQLGWDMFVGLVSAGALVGGAILLASPDVRIAIGELWRSFREFNVSGPTLAGSAAVGFAGYRGYVAVGRARAFYYRTLFYLEREDKLAALELNAPLQENVIRTTVVSFDSRRDLANGPVAPLFSFRVNKDRAESYLIVSGVISFFAGASGAAVVNWKWQNRNGQTLVFASQVHTYGIAGIATPTLCVIDTRDQGEGVLSCYCTSTGPTQHRPAHMLNPNSGDYPHLAGQTNSTFRIDEIAGKPIQAVRLQAKLATDMSSYTPLSDIQMGGAAPSATGPAAAPAAVPSLPQRAVVRYTYVAEDQNQLSLIRVGDVITVHSQDSEDWWDGEFEGRRGYLPAQYVELMDFSIPDYDSAAARTGTGAGPAVDDDAWERRAAASLAVQASTAQLMQNSAAHTTSVAMYLGQQGASSAPLLSGQAAAAGSDDLFWSQTEMAQSPSDVLSGGGSANGSGYGAGPGFFGLGPSNSLFALWSSSLGKLAAVAALFMGALTLLMGEWNHDFFEDVYVYVGAYSMVLGVLTLLYELFFGRPQRTASRLPWRAIGYGVCMVPLMVAYPTRIPGVLYATVALLNLVSACRGESVSMRARREQRQVEAAQTMIDYTNMSAGSVPQSGSSSSFLPRSFVTFFLDRSVRFRFRRWALLLFYVVAGNTALVVLCWAVLVRDVHKKWELDEDGQPWNRWWQIGLIAQWLLLLSLIPFFFTTMRWASRQLYDLAVGASMASTTSFAARAAQFLLTFLPPDPHNTLLFYHKFIAAAVMLYSCVHGLAHTLSFMVEPRDTLDYYGRSSYWVHTSGAIMIVLLIIIYSAARREIREGSLLLFRWVHALYAPFLLLLVLHSKSGFSTLAVLFVLIPMSLWLLDNTALAPDAWRHFEEGAFAYVKFPAVSTSIAIPVTISSPPPAMPMAAAQADGWSAMDVSGSSSSGMEMMGADAGGSAAPGSITLHLQIDSASLHSYTARVQEMFESLGPLGSSHYILDRAMRVGSEASVGAAGRGLLRDRSGRRLVQLDGPHPSPVSHVTRYTSCMVVAPSAGVPALSSVLRSVVLQRWKQQLVGVGAGGGIGQKGAAAPRGFYSTPHALFLFWILPWDEIDDHRWFLQTIKDVSDELYLMRERPGSESFLRHKHLEIHIHVTGVPSDSSATAGASAHAHGHGQGHAIPPAALTDDQYFGPVSGPTGPAAADVATRWPFSTLQLYRALKNPTAQAAQLSDVHVHRGAPHWADRFNEVAYRATGQTDVGCIYTAGPASQLLTTTGARALHAAGIPAPSVAQIHAYQRTSAQLKEHCAHHARQTGKAWRYHTDLDI